jgi:serine/threonine protein kinase
LEFKIKNYALADLLDEKPALLSRCNLIEQASISISAIPRTSFTFLEDRLEYRQEFVKKENWTRISLERKKTAVTNLAIDLDEMLNMGLVHGDLNHSNIIFDGNLLRLIDFEPSFRQVKNQRRILASGLSFRSKNDYHNNSITSETDKIGFYFFCEYQLTQGNELGYSREKFTARLKDSLAMRTSEEELIQMKFTDILHLF